MIINLNDIAVLNIHGVDYRGIISRINKSEVINLMQNIDLTKKSRTLKKQKNLLEHIKIDEEIIRSGNIQIEYQKFYRYKRLIS